MGSTINPCLNEELRQHIELSVQQTLDDCLHALTSSEGLFTHGIVKEVCVSLKNAVARSPDMTIYYHEKLEVLFCGIYYSLFFLECSVQSKFHPSSRLS